MVIKTLKHLDLYKDNCHCNGAQIFCRLSTATDKSSKVYWQVKIYAIFVSILISFGLLICVVAYIQIVNVIRKQLKGEKKRSSPNKVTTLTQMTPEVRRRSESTTSDNGKMLTLHKRKNREQNYKPK
jgi:hypothetical protein